MNEKVFDKVTQYIDALAAKLGVAAEHVYGVLVRQQMAEGITYTTILTVVFIALLVSFFKIFKAYKNYDGYDDEPYVIGLMVTGIFAVLVFIINIFVLPDYIMRIVNPEYYAIREILDAIK